MDRRDQYIEAAFKLSRVHPDTWKQFYDAFSAYAMQSTIIAAQTVAPEMLVRNTHRASALLDIMKDFGEIDGLYQGVANKQSRQQNGR